MNEYLIAQLKKGRLDKNLKQSDVTKLTGIKNTTLSNYENGITEPDIDTFLQLCELYNLDYATILAEAYGLKVSGTDFNIKPSEMEYIEKYRSLDPHGKDMVDTVLDRENKRIQQYGKLEDRKVVILAEYEASKAPTHIIPYWEYGVSAGNGIYQLNDTTSVMMTLWATEVTKQADFIIKVSGASMEPDYHDGDKVLVDRKTVVEKGEVGIFVKNGDTYIKELGENELISRNSEFPNIPVKDFDNVVCLGKVIGILTDSLIAKE